MFAILYSSFCIYH